MRDKGLAEPEVLELLRQNLEALAALHEAGLVHGDIRPDNIILDPEANGHRVAWVANVETGLLSSWSGGAILPSDAADYYPPDWNMGIGDPCPRADLYALGLLACHMLLGPNGPPRQLKMQAGGADIRKVIRRLLLKHGRLISRRATRFLVEGLLNPDPQQRPADARAAINQLPGRRLRRFLGSRR